MSPERLPLHEAAMAELLPIAAALRASLELDDAEWAVVLDALADAVLMGAGLGADAVVAHASAAHGTFLDVELDLMPPIEDELA